MQFSFNMSGHRERGCTTLTACMRLEQQQQASYADLELMLKALTHLEGFE